MKLLKGIGIALCLGVLCLLVAPKTKADEQGSKTVVTFTVPVEVPGVGAQTLPAGTYLFKALDSSQDRDIIQISNPDGTHVFTTFVGVPNSRLKAPDLITVMFTNRPASDPQALKAWYCPGRTWGDQVVYEQPRATQLAKETNEPVLSTSVTLAAASVEVLKTAPIGAVGPTRETVALAQIVDAPLAVAPALAVAAESTASPAPVAAVEPAAVVASPSAPATTVAVASVPTAETVTATEPTVSAGPAVAVVPPPAPAPTVAAEPAVAPVPMVAVEPVVAPAPVAVVEPVATPAPTVTAVPAVAVSPEVASATLPQTASLLPLIGLVGLLMLGAGFLLTSLVKRRV
jgi:hypothetical protein